MDEEELKNRLTKEQYKVLRQKGTEMPFTGKYVHKNTDGTYVCMVCDNPLFTSDAQFDSGTGWPSFTDVKKGNVTLTPDNNHGMNRIEVTCATCGGHLGHVFDDGPGKTGKRYCINSVCLELKKENRVENKYGQGAHAYRVEWTPNKKTE